MQKAEEVDYTPWATKPATDVQERFAAWITENTGYNPAAAKTKLQAFQEGVRLGTALRMPFQSSPENQEVLAARRAEIEARKAAKSAPAKKAPAAKKAAPAKKAAAKKAAPPVETEEEDLEPEEVEAEEVETEEEEVAPAPAPKRRAPAKRASASRAPAPF